MKVLLKTVYNTTGVACLPRQQRKYVATGSQHYAEHL